MGAASMAGFELTELERRLLRLALCSSAQGAEISTSATKLIQSWRARGVESSALENVFSGGQDGVEVVIQMSRPDYGLTVCPFKKYRGEMLMNIPPSYLHWILGWINEAPDRATKFKDFAYAVEEFLKQGS
jgi:hypothetical protein